MKKIEEAGIQVVGISYDDVALLKKFSSDKRLQFPLLSDPDSKVIDDFHLVNEAMKGRGAAVPYPGTYLLDSTGVIRAKLFLEGYRDRHTTEALIDAAKSFDLAPGEK